MVKITNPQTGRLVEVGENDLPQPMPWTALSDEIGRLGGGGRLPTLEELFLLHQEHHKGLGNFKSASYWGGHETIHDPTPYSYVHERKHYLSYYVYMPHTVRSINMIDQNTGPLHPGARAARTLAMWISRARGILPARRRTAAEGCRAARGTRTPPRSRRPRAVPKTGQVDGRRRSFR